MTTTTATSTDLRGASTSTYKPGSRRPSRRTTLVLAGAAAVAITAGSVVVGLQMADADPAPAVVGVSSAVGNDPAGPQHGLGPVNPSVARHAASIEATQVAHGTAGALSDAAGHPLLP